MNKGPSVLLEQVKALFEDWRRQRVKREPIPHQLWQAAAKLHDHYGISHICKELRLSNKQFNKYLNKGKSRQQTKTKRAAKSAFFKLNTRDLKLPLTTMTPVATVLSHLDDYNAQMLIENNKGVRITLSIKADTNTIADICAELMRV